MHKLMLGVMLFGGLLSSWAGSNGPYTTFGVSEDGAWNKVSCKFRLQKEIGLLHSGYVYTNRFGIVHQFNFEHTFTDKISKASAIDALKETEKALAERLNLSPFKTHVDSNPNRYLWSEAASLTKYPGWSVRMYLEEDAKRNTLVAKCSVWNAKLESREAVVK